MINPEDTIPIVILHVITGLRTGGAELSLARLVAASDPRRFRHVVVSMTGHGTVGSAIEASGVPLHSLDMKRGRPGLRALVRLHCILRRVRPDIVHTWLYHADLMGTVAARLSRRRAIIWGLRCSDMDLSGYSRWTLVVRALLARLSALPSVIVANSRAGMLFHEGLGYRPRRWEYIANGVDTEAFRFDAAKRAAFRERYGIPAETVVIGMASRWDPMKDHRTFLQAAGKLHRQRPGFLVLLAGRGCTDDNPELSREIAAAALAGVVRPIGEQTDMPGFLAAIDVFCLCSAFGEGFSNTLAEAAAVGRPCVATDVGDAAEILGRHCRLVPPRDADALADALRGVLELTPRERAALGSAARNRIVSAFPMTETLRRYEALYTELALNRGHESRLGL